MQARLLLVAGGFGCGFPAIITLMPFIRRGCFIQDEWFVGQNTTQGYHPFSPNPYAQASILGSRTTW